MKKVLFIGFNSVQIELSKKFLAFRHKDRDIEIISEQQNSAFNLDAYVVNGDDPSAENRLALHTRVSALPVLGIGAKAILGVTSYASGPFKPATVDRLADMLGLGSSTNTVKPIPPSGSAEPGKPTSISNVVAFPGSLQTVPASVLVVDDSLVVQSTMVRKIKEYGHQVDVASSGTDALAMLLSTPYKLVFLDVMMPGMDGFEVCKRIKRSAEYRNSAVYLLTSKDGIFDKVRGSLAGCNGYLVKPLESSQLKSVLTTHFGEAKSPAESDMLSASADGQAFNAAELAAINGTPPVAEAAVQAAHLLAEGPESDFKLSFAATEPVTLEQFTNNQRS